jgi:mannose-1-phosphate guanylyltransferase
MQAMLLAAGFGTRLRPYTLIRPKPLFPVLNVPLLHILLDQLKQANCRQVVVNCHHLAEQIEAAVADRSEVILQYEPEILGTGGSLRKALSLFSDEPVLVMNGDIYHDIDLAGLVQHHVDSGLPVTMAMHDYSRFNSVHVQDGLVRSFSPDSGSERGELLAFTGIHVLELDVIKKIPEHGFFHIIDLYRRLAAVGHLGCRRVDGCFWRDIGTAEDYLDLHRQLIDDDRQKFSDCRTGNNGWCISGEAKVADDVCFREWGTVGPHAEIGSGSELSRCVVWDGATVAPGRRLTNTIVCHNDLA